MPKSSLKIDRFDGGINRKVESRDLPDNESRILVDVNIDTVGRVSMAGGAVPYVEQAEKIEVRDNGWGLFAFRSDYDIVDDEGIKGGSFLHGSDDIGKRIDSELGSETSIDIIAKLFDPAFTDSGKRASITLKEGEANLWTSLADALPLYEEDDFVLEPVHPNFHVKNGDLRIWDSQFKQFGMFTKWLGVIKDTKFIGKDNINYNSDKTPDWNKANVWLYTHADCKAPTSLPKELNKRTGLHIAALSAVLESAENQTTVAMDGLDTNINFVVGDIIKINNELMYVSTGQTSSSGNVIVVRGVYGSKVAEHADDSLIYLVYRDSFVSETGEKYSPANYGFYSSKGDGEVSYKEHACQVMATDFTRSDEEGYMYKTITPMQTAADFTSTDYDSDATEAHSSYGGWGVATDGINHWAREFDGIHFMYEFVQQGETTEEQLKDSWLQGNKFRFYATLIYDGSPDAGGQESALTDITPSNSNILNKNAHLYCNIAVKWTGKNYNDTAQNNEGNDNSEDAITGTNKEQLKELYINPRVTGCRIYYSSSEDNDLTKFLLLTAYFDENGGIKREGGDYMPWCPINYGNIASSNNEKLSYYRVSSKSDTFDKINAPHQLNLSKSTGSLELGPEQITALDNRNFSSGLGSWVVYDPDGATSASVSHDSGGLTGNNNVLILNNSVDNANEGAQLPIAHLDGANQDNSIEANTTYKIDLTLKSAAGTPTITVGLGGGTASIGAISTSWKDYSATVKTSDSTGALLIYYTSTDNAHNVVLDKIGVKKVIDSVKDECFYVQSPPGGITYDGINGHDGEITDILYKCSTEVNGIRYVGNVCYPVNWDNDLFEDDTLFPGASFEDLTRGTKYGDRMIRSAVGQFDVLNPQINVDVAINDGEEITHLESLGSYLLQFKENTLYILNVSVENNEVKESVQGTYKFKGVAYPFNVVKTDREIVWINKYGAYVFNGESVQDISKDKIPNLFQNRDLAKVTLGFDIFERTVIFFSNDESSSNSSYTYNLNYNAWVENKEAFRHQGIASNFTTERDGKVIFSIFNESDTGKDLLVNGVYFEKNELGQHFIKTSSDSPTQQEGSAFSFIENNEFIPGNKISILNTGIKKSKVESSNLNFKEFTLTHPFDVQGEIVFICDETLSTSAAHLDINDVIHITPNSRTFTTTHPSWTGTYEIKGLSGYWKVVHRWNIGTSFQNPISTDAGFEMLEDIIHKRDTGTIPGQDDLFDQETEEEVEEDDDIIPEEFGGVKFPNAFMMKKITNVGEGYELEGLKILWTDSGLNDSPDITNAFISFFTSQEGNNGSANTLFTFKDSTSALSPVNWGTVFNLQRQFINNGKSLNSANYFDGVYKIKSRTATSLEVFSDYADGDGSGGHWGNTNENISNFERLYYDKFDNGQIASTAKGVYNHTGGSYDYTTHFPVTNLQKWDSVSKSTPYFRLMTKELDFGEPSRSKKIYKLYVTYSCAIEVPMVRVYLIVNTVDGTFIIFPNVEKSKNYGLYQSHLIDFHVHDNNPIGVVETFSPGLLTLGDQHNFTETVAEIEFLDPNNYLKKAKTVRVAFCNSLVNLTTDYTTDLQSSVTITDPSSSLIGSEQNAVSSSKNFVLNDINIIYRGKSVK